MWKSVITRQNELLPDPETPIIVARSLGGAQAVNIAIPTGITAPCCKNVMQLKHQKFFEPETEFTRNNFSTNLRIKSFIIVNVLLFLKYEFTINYITI